MNTFDDDCDCDCAYVGPTGPRGDIALKNIILSVVIYMYRYIRTKFVSIFL